MKEFIVNEFNKELIGQVSKKTSFDVKFKLNMFDDKSKGIDAIENQLKNLMESIDVDSIYNNNLLEFSTYVTDKDYSKILKVFNRKSLPARISSYFDLAKNKYPDFVLRLMNSSHNKNIIKILSSYTPKL